VLSSGVSGAVARTVVAPVERNRLLMQAQTLFPRSSSSLVQQSQRQPQPQSQSQQQLQKNVVDASKLQSPLHQRPAVRGLFQGLRAIYRHDGTLESLYRQVLSRIACHWSFVLHELESGFTGLYRGNGLNVTRIVPCLAIEFTLFERLKHAWIDSPAFLYFHPVSVWQL
jgi:hypothetical protein